MEEILALRHEMAQLLGYANYAELSLATKMAESPDEVESFLVDLAHRAKPAAQADLDELKAFAKQRDGLDDFSPWAAPYYAENLKEQKLGLSDEDQHPYFAFDKVLAGMVEGVPKMYGITQGHNRKRC